MIRRPHITRPEIATLRLGEPLMLHDFANALLMETMYAQWAQAMSVDYNDPRTGRIGREMFMARLSLIVIGL